MMAKVLHLYHAPTVPVLHCQLMHQVTSGRLRLGCLQWHGQCMRCKFSLRLINARNLNLLGDSGAGIWSKLWINCALGGLAFGAQSP